MTIKPVQSVDAIEKIHKVFGQIFEPYPGVPIPFTSDVESRELLYPVGYMLDHELYGAIRKAALFAGDTVFYLSLLDQLKAEDENINWIIPLNNEDYFRFHQERNVMENAIYSPQGKWGVVYYDPKIMLIGGEEEFTKMFFESLPSGKKEEHLDAFLRDYKYYVASSFDPDYIDLSIFLKHMYGNEKATFLINKYSLRR